MRFAVAVVAALAGLVGLAGSATATSLPPWCPKACPGCSHWSKYSGRCNYPAQRPIPQDPWNRGNGMGQGFQWNSYVRSPRDFWMVQP